MIDDIDLFENVLQILLEIGFDKSPQWNMFVICFSYVFHMSRRATTLAFAKLWPWVDAKMPPSQSHLRSRRTDTDLLWRDVARDVHDGFGACFDSVQPCQAFLNPAWHIFRI